MHRGSVEHVAAAEQISDCTVFSLTASKTSLFYARRLLAPLVNWYVLDHHFLVASADALTG